MTTVVGRSRVVAPQLIIGLLLLAGGVVTLLDNIGVMNGERVLRLWPAGLILIGVVLMAQAHRAAGRVSGLFWVFIGTWLLLGKLGLWRLDLWDLWPVPIVMVGAYLIWQAIHGPDSAMDRERESQFSALAIMAGVGRKINSQEFVGGEVTALMGGVKIDLKDAVIAGEEAVIDVFAFWGGIELHVPEGWSVVNRVMAILGGAEDTTRPSTSPVPKRLVIRGVCIMGGIEIKSA